MESKKNSEHEDVPDKFNKDAMHLKKRPVRLRRPRIYVHHTFEYEKKQVHHGMAL